MTMDVLVRGVFLGMKHAIPVMKAQGAGSIINTGSIAGVTAGRGPIVYSAAKAAVVHLSKLGAMQLGADSIRVNAICPGYIATPLSANTVGKPDSLIDERVDNTQGVNPFREWAAQMTLPMALYLASDSPHSLPVRLLSSTAASHRVSTGPTSDRPIEPIGLSESTILTMPVRLPLHLRHS